MSLNHSLIGELKQEAANTRKMLERVPIDNNDWKPHEKSMKLGRLASHIAELPGWITMTMMTDELDFEQFDYKPHMPVSREELLAKHDENVAQAISILENANYEDFDKMWTMRRGEHVFFTLPKKVVMRSFSFNHMYHHRGQLSVYLRLLNVPVPGIYGPSADDAPMVEAKDAAAN